MKHKVKENSEAIIKMYQDGTPILEISERFGVSYQSVYAYMKRHKIKISRRLLLFAHEAEIRDMLSCGHTVMNIARTFRVTPQTVYNFMREQNIFTQRSRLHK